MCNCIAVFGVYRSNRLLTLSLSLSLSISMSINPASLLAQFETDIKIEVDKIEFTRDKWEKKINELYSASLNEFERGALFKAVLNKAGSAQISGM